MQCRDSIGPMMARRRNMADETTNTAAPVAANEGGSSSSVPSSRPCNSRHRSSRRRTCKPFCGGRISVRLRAVRQDLRRDAPPAAAHAGHDRLRHHHQDVSSARNCCCRLRSRLPEPLCSSFRLPCFSFGPSSAQFNLFVILSEARRQLSGVEGPLSPQRTSCSQKAKRLLESYPLP